MLFVTHLKIPAGALLLILLFSGAEVLSAQNFSDRFELHGQMRSGYYMNSFSGHTGETVTINELRLRSRIGIQYRVNDQMDLRIRYAGRFSTEQNSFRFWAKTGTPAASGLQLGDSTLDEVNITWRPASAVWIRAGRFQLSHPLRGVVAKGLNRYDSPNTSVAYTNGIWARLKVDENWNLHLLAEYNSQDGPGSVARAPLQFDNRASRVTYWAMIQHRDTEGLWTQRELSVSYLPETFAKDDQRKSYLVFTTRIGMRLPVEISWVDLSAGFEGGYIPDTPSETALGFAEGDLSGDHAIAWQAALNLQNMNFFNHRHNAGILYGRTDPGWLVSPSFIPNSRTIEGRYQFWFNRSLSFELRYRYRPELVTPSAFTQQASRQDLYARLTYRF